MIVARELGLFPREGLSEPEYVSTRSSTEQFRDLVSGDIDVAATAADNAIAAQLRGDPVRIFHVADIGLDQFAVAGRGVSTWGDVRGRAIGVDSSSSGYAYILYRMLADHGIATTAVEIVELGGPESRYAALADGSVAVGMLNPFLAERARRAGLTVLGAGAERFPDYPNLVFAATEARLAADPSGFAAYTRAIDEAVRWIGDERNAEEAIRLIGDARGLDPVAARELYTDEQRLRRVAAPDGAGVRRSLAVVAGLREEFTGESLAPEVFATAGLLAR